MIKKVLAAIGGCTCCAVGGGAAGYGICHEVEKEDNQEENSSLSEEDKDKKITELKNQINALTTRLSAQKNDSEKDQEITKLKAELATEKAKHVKSFDEDSFMNAAVSNRLLWSWVDDLRKYTSVSFSNWKNSKDAVKDLMFFFENKSQIKTFLEKILPIMPPKSMNNTVDIVWNSLSSTTKDGRNYGITVDNFRKIFFK